MGSNDNVSETEEGMLKTTVLDNESEAISVNVLPPVNLLLQHKEATRNKTLNQDLHTVISHLSSKSIIKEPRKF